MPSRTQVPAKIGRPTKYSDEWARQFCDLISQGKSVVDVCAMEGQPSRDSVYAWMRERQEFSDMYARAREERADLLFERIAAIADAAAQQRPLPDAEIVCGGEVILNIPYITRSPRRRG